MEGYPFVVPIEVRWRDLDPFDHVNNAVFVTYLEFARVALWRRFGSMGRASDVPFVVARVVLDYRSPVRLGDEVRVGLRLERLGEKSFTFAYRIEAAGRLAAEAETVQVCLDHETGQTIPVPDSVRKVLSELS